MAQMSAEQSYASPLRISGGMKTGVPKTGFSVAIKVMTSTPQLKITLVREIKILSNSFHPNIVQSYDSFCTEGKVWIIMELCLMGCVLDVKEILSRPFTELEMASIMDFILKGLQYLHSNRIIHRDIKCQNILMTSSAQPKLADFGIARHLDADERACTVIGTPVFMPPEILKGLAYDCSADIWAIGITMLQLGGEMPYKEVAPVCAIYKIITEPPPNFKDGSHTPVCCQFVSACLVDPSSRPPCNALREHPFIHDTDTSSSKVLGMLKAEYFKKKRKTVR